MKPSQSTRQPQAAEKIRLFIAIDLPESLRDAIRAIQTDIRGSGFKAKWTAPENMHLTLKFLGNADAYYIDKINQAIQTTVQEMTPFQLSGRRLGVFPNPRRPRVIWIGLQGDIGTLLGLQKQVEAQMALLGFPKEKRTFTGHLTIGRIKGKASLRQVDRMLTQYETLETDVFRVNEIILFKSQLKPSGPIYTRLGVARLE